MSPCLGVERPAARKLGRVAEAGDGGVLGGLRDVEGVPHLLDRVHCLPGADPVADAQPREAVDLREGAQHEHVAALLHVLLDPVWVVRLVDVLEVRLVEDGENVARDALEEGVHLLARDHRPGRVVRVAEVDDLRAGGDRAEDALDVVGVVGERNTNRRRAQLERGERVARKGRPAEDDLVPRVERGERKVRDDRVGAGCHGDVGRLDAVLLGERLDEAPGASVGVAVELGKATLECLEGSREGPELPLVGGQLHHPLEAELALDLFDGLARLVRNELRERGPG